MIKTVQRKALLPGGVDTQFVNRMIKTDQRKSVFPGEVETQVRKLEDKDKTGERRFFPAKLILKFVSRKIKTDPAEQISLAELALPRKQE